MDLKKIKELANEIYDNLTTEEKQLFDSTKCVLSSGDINSKLMVVARDLGQDEIEKEIPLIGRAGQIFRMVERILINSGKINSVYVTNIAPFKPVNNIAFPKEIRKKFRSILIQQIELVKPRIIVTMGNEAFQELTGFKNGGIINLVKNKNLFETWSDINPKCIVIPCVHPSYLYRMGITKSIITKNMNKELIENFKTLFLNPLLNAVNIIKDYENIEGAETNFIYE